MPQSFLDKKLQILYFGRLGDFKTCSLSTWQSCIQPQHFEISDLAPDPATWHLEPGQERCSQRKKHGSKNGDVHWGWCNLMMMMMSSTPLVARVYAKLGMALTLSILIRKTRSIHSWSSASSLKVAVHLTWTFPMWNTLPTNTGIRLSIWLPSPSPRLTKDPAK